MKIKDYLDELGINYHACVVLNHVDEVVPFDESYKKYKKHLRIRNTIEHLDLVFYIPKSDVYCSDFLYEIKKAHNGMHEGLGYGDAVKVGVGIKEWNHIVLIKEKLKEFLNG